MGHRRDKTTQSISMLSIGMIVIALIIQPVSVPTDITFVSSVGSLIVLFIHVLLLYFIVSTLELQEMSGKNMQAKILDAMIFKLI